MTSLTPLTKGLMGLAVVAALTTAIWHLSLKQRFGGASLTTVPGSAQAAQGTKTIALSASESAEYAETGRKLINSGDFGQARAHLELAVQSGNGSAACLLGEMTLKGQGGLPASREQAAGLFQFAQSRNILCFTMSRS